MKPPLFQALLLVVVIVGLTAPHAWSAPAPRKKLVMLISGQSYETERTLPAFAAQFLRDRFNVVVVSGAMTNPAQRFDHFEEIADADVLLVSVWRRSPPQEQLEVIRRYVESGKSIVGIATASHAFAPGKGKTLPAGAGAWPEWDAQVIGGHYTGHHPIGYITTVTAVDANHPLLAGVRLPFRSKMELNQVTPLNPAAHPLLTGTIEGRPPEPVAWTFQHSGNGKTFFTPLGHPEDFAQPAFQQLLLNAIWWAADLPPTTVPSAERKQ